MQKLVKIDNYNNDNNYNNTNDKIGETIEQTNKLLEDGWKVIQMCPLSEQIGIGRELCFSEKGNYGVLLLLEKEDYKIK